jgi:hypothetical protein
MNAPSCNPCVPASVEIGVEGDGSHGASGSADWKLNGRFVADHISPAGRTLVKAMMATPDQSRPTSMATIHRFVLCNPGQFASRVRRTLSTGNGKMERRHIMMYARTFAICAFAVLSVTHRVEAQGPVQYRDYALGSDLASVSDLSGVPASTAKTIHQRPEVLQDLQWRPSRWNLGSTAASTDPVEQIVFSFYNDRLFRVVVDYAHDRTEGMTDADMIEAISAVYGTPVKRAPGAVRVVASQLEVESGSPVARWGDAGHGVVLYRTSSYREAFRLIVTEPALDALARKATTQAMRLDEIDAPRREIARQKKEQDDGRAAAEKARIANKDGFRP